MPSHSAMEFLPGHRFYDKQSERALISIVVSVFLIHAALLLFSALFTEEKPLPPPKIKQIVVKTITLGEKPHEKPKAVPIIEQMASEPEPVAIAEPEPIAEAARPPAPEPVILKEEPTPVIEETPPPPPAPKPKEQPKPAPKKPAIKKPEPPKKKPAPVKKPAPPKPKPQAKTAPKKPPATTPKKPEVKKDPPKKTPVQKKQAEPPKPKPVEEAPPVPKVDPQAEAAKARKRELLEKAQKSIAQIEESGKLSAKSSSTALTAAVPGRIDALQVETFPDPSEGKLNPQEMSYYEELASRLKLLLRLPEFGEVKIKLTLERSGQFIKVSVVNTESANNKKYVEKTLPTLKYPAFGNNFTGSAQYTFVIALSNEL